VAGTGPTLAPSFDEYAEYFLRTMDATGRVDPLLGNFPGPPLDGADIGQVDPAFVEQFPMIVLRRGADRTRPPFNYRLVHRDRFYDVWRRAQPPSVMLGHVTLQGPAQRRPGCRALARQLTRTPHATSLVWSTAPTPVGLDPTTFSHAPGWGVDPARGLVTSRAGRADGDARFPHDGRYALWVRGSFGRAVHFFVDGQEVGTVADEADYPGEEHFVGSARVSAGTHHVSFVRGGGNLRPGNGDVAANRAVGTLYFVSGQTAGNRLFRTPVGAAYRVCRSSRPLAWVEVAGPESGA